MHRHVFHISRRCNSVFAASFTRELELEGASIFAKPFYRMWTPPHTSSLEEASSYTPKSLYREDSYAEYVAPNEDRDQEYACFGNQLVDLKKGLATPGTEAPTGPDDALDGVWHPQDWPSELLLSSSPVDAATYADAGGSARPSLRRGKSFASYAGELDAIMRASNKAEPACGEAAMPMALDTKPTKIRTTAATWHPFRNHPQVQVSSMEQAFIAAPPSSSPRVSLSLLDAADTYAGPGASGKAPSLRRGKSFASYAGELEDSYDMGWKGAGKALGMAPSAVNWQPSWHLQVSPMRQGARATASYSSRAIMAKKRPKRLALSAVKKGAATPLPTHHPFDEGDGIGWGTPRCPVP